MESSPQLASLPRRLAAIMFADIMGYTALMQQDEHQAITLRDRMHQLMKKMVPKHGGKIVQFYGDGMLAVFNSAANGVTCAVEVQRELQKAPNVPLRIGLHSGDVAYDEHNVYGDCVNVASRIESLSSPGAVLVSDKVFDEIKNQASITTASLGFFDLKNVKRRIEVFAVTNEGLVVPTVAQTSEKAKQGKSMAVLPFRNLSADPENEYFSEGISEEILNALSKVDGLQVCSRTSSFVFKDQQEDVRSIGKKLGVTAVLEGSVRRGGNKVRISAQLVSTADGYQIWSETFDGDLDDIFKVQDEISSQIADRLRSRFTGDLDKATGSVSHDHTIKPPTDNLDAYNYYLKGRYHWNKSNPEDIRKAIGHLEKAIELDPTYAPPYCLLSYCYSFLGSTGAISSGEAFSKAKDCTLHAIDIDPNHAESHLSLASIKFYQNWDFDGAEVSLTKARSLGLNSSLLNQLEGTLLIARGRFDEAVQKIEQALRQEPLSLSLSCLLADAYAFARRFDDAHAEYDKVLELDPNFRRAYEGKGLAYLAVNDYDKAIENLERYHKMVGNPLKGLLVLGYAYGLAGRQDKAMECLEKHQQREKMEAGVNLDLEYAMIYAGLQDYEMALEYFRKIYDQRMSLGCIGMIYCARYPVLKELKSRPQFTDIVSKMGLN